MKKATITPQTFDGYEGNPIEGYAISDVWLAARTPKGSKFAWQLWHRPSRTYVTFGRTKAHCVRTAEVLDQVGSWEHGVPPSSEFVELQTAFERARLLNMRQDAEAKLARVKEKERKEGIRK